MSGAAIHSTSSAVNRYAAEINKCGNAKIEIPITAKNFWDLLSIGAIFPTRWIVHALPRMKAANPMKMGMAPRSESKSPSAIMAGPTRRTPSGKKSCFIAPLRYSTIVPIILAT